MSLQVGRAWSRVTQICLLALVVCAVAQAQKIKVEYDKSLDFSQFKTYAWGHHDAVSRPMLALLTPPPWTMTRQAGLEKGGN